MHLFMYLIKLGLLQSGTGQSEFKGNFLRGGGQGIKQKDKHNHLSKQFVCAASSCYGLSTTLLWSVPRQICHLGTQLQSNETICLSKYTCRPKTVHLKYWWTNFRRHVHSVKTVNQKRDKLNKHHSGKKTFLRWMTHVFVVQ